MTDFAMLAEPFTIDIECVGVQGLAPCRVNELVRSECPKNYTKAETIRQWVLTNRSKVLNKTALDAMRGRILCVSVAVGADEPVTCSGLRPDPGGFTVEGWDKHERSILEWLIDKVKSLENPPLWILHHAPFDLHYLFVRAIKYGLDASVIPHTKWLDSSFVFDTKTAWQGPDHRARSSLKDVAEYLGIKRDPLIDDIRGSDVHDLFERNQWATIERYCADDVNITRELYQRLTGRKVTSE